MRFFILLANLVITVVVLMSLSAYLAQDVCLDRGGKVLHGSLCKFESGVVERILLTPIQLSITLIVSCIVGFISRLVFMRLQAGVKMLIEKQGTHNTKDVN